MKKIMVIDDDPVWTTLCEGLLQGSGFEVLIAEDGEQALQSLVTYHPDLIVLDLHMRKMNGVEVLKHVRARLATVSTPVIAFSAASTTRLLEHALNAGASRFLAKDHFDPDRFLEMIRATLYSLDHTEIDEPVKPPVDVPVAQESQPKQSTSLSLNFDALKSHRSELRQKFLKEVPLFLSAMNIELLGFLKDSGNAGCRPFLAQLKEGIRSLMVNARLLGFGRIEQLTRVLEWLLDELENREQAPGVATLTIIDQALEVLGTLFENTGQPGSEDAVLGLALVLNNDAAEHSMIDSAMESAHLKWIGMEDPNLALKTLSTNRVDLVLLNSDLPGIKDANFTATVRAQPRNRATPLLWFADNVGSQNPHQSNPAGNDHFLIAPFLASELALKSLTCVLKKHSNAL